MGCEESRTADFGTYWTSWKSPVWNSEFAEGGKTEAMQIKQLGVVGFFGRIIQISN